MLHLTHDTLCVCGDQGEGAVVVIDVKSILSVVAMVPFPFIVGGRSKQYFMIEQIGLDIVKTDVLAAQFNDD